MTPSIYSHVHTHTPARTNTHTHIHTHTNTHTHTATTSLIVYLKIFHLQRDTNHDYLKPPFLFGDFVLL